MPIHYLTLKGELSMLSIGQKFPLFNLTAVHVGDKDTAFKPVNNETYKGKWQVWFFWPKDFTFVCPTEIVGFGELNKEFADRDAQLIGASIDSDFVHLAWRQNDARLANSPFPWVSDIKRDLSTALGILHDEAGVPLRATFIVDPEGIIRYVQANDLSVGRNPKEVLRVLDALQTDELCPCNWTQGEKTLS